MKPMHRLRILLFCTALAFAALCLFLFAKNQRNAGKSPELIICQNAIEAFDKNYQLPTAEFRCKIGHRTLMLLSTEGNAHVYGWSNLVAAVWDEWLNCQVGKSFVLLGDSGQWSYEKKEGEFQITLSNGTLAFCEYYSTGTWLLTFDGKHLKSECIAEPAMTPACD